MIEVHFRNGSIKTFDCSNDEMKKIISVISSGKSRILPFIWIGNKMLNLSGISGINYFGENKIEKEEKKKNEMTFTIYDYDNNAVKVQIPAKTVDDIELIDIIVLSGDETGKVILKNGDIIHFDASSHRHYDRYDGNYFVQGSEKIKQWLEFEPTYSDTATYERQGIFDKRNSCRWTRKRIK